MVADWRLTPRARASRALAVAGFTYTEAAAVIEEGWRFVRTSWMTGALEEEDVWAEAVAAALEVRRRYPEGIEGSMEGYLHRRIRGALLRLALRERRATGRNRVTFFWPWYRPEGDRAEDRRTCEEEGCEQLLAPLSGRRRCPEHAAARAAELKRERQARYRRRCRGEEDG